MKKIILGLIVALSLNADFTSGNELQEWMSELKKENGNLHSIGLFRGYVSGIVDIGDGILFCTPQGTTRGQYTAVAIKYIEHNPEKWNLGASTIIQNALENAFPCKKKK